MSEIVLPAMIAAITSLLICIITVFQFFRQQRLQVEQFEKEQNRSLTSKLYDLRLEYYPKAFEITDKIHKNKGGNFDPAVLKDVLDELMAWKKGVVDIIISIEALESYFYLRDTLMKNPESREEYSGQQVEKISVGAKNFRKQLRRDIGFMFREEKERRSR